MSNQVKTRRRVLIVVGVVALACVMLGMAVTAAGGVVYALTQRTDWLRQWTEEVSLPLPSQKAVDDDERGIVVPLAAGDDEQGIVVAAVVEDGAAAAAGVKRGDILLEMDGEAMNSLVDLLDALAELEPGEEVELLLQHGDEARRLTATLDERDGRAFLGLVPCCAFRQDDVTLRGLTRIPAGGAMITDVLDDSPAADASLEEGDLVLAVDGEALGDKLILADAIRAHQPGDRVTLTVRSSAKDQEREVTVELGENPDNPGVAYLGVTYIPAPAVRMRRFRLPCVPLPEHPRVRPHIERFREAIPEGLPRVVVIEVVADSPAEEAGLLQGDVIRSIDGEPVETAQDVVRAVTAREPGDELTLTIHRPEEGEDEERDLSVTLGDHPDGEDRAYLGVRLGLDRVHFRRFGGEWGPEGWHREFDLPEDWDLPFDLDELPEHFEFDFWPGDGTDHWEVLPDY
ncbi:MAG: PDZ domain-containing protein [Anaerolineae bacterium]